MAREIMSTKQVAEHFNCSARCARNIMKEVGIIDIGHGFIYRDALSRYEAQKTEHTVFTLPVLQEDYPTKNPRYPRERRTAK